MKFSFVFIMLGLVSFGCKERDQEQNSEEKAADGAVEARDTVSRKPTVPEKKLRSFEGLADTTFVRLANFSDEFAYDLRYATENNFLKEQVYDCAECFTRVKTAKALMAANADFKILT